MIKPRIIIVGGGAGGLELATQLGRKLGKKGKANITLVDKNATHLWKPLLHEVATGSLDEGVDAVSYRAHAANHHFDFQLGTFAELDRANKQIILAPLTDEGEQVLPERRLDYDMLVMALGSVSNDFGTEGIREHCIFLDSPDQALKFHRLMLNAFMQLQAKEPAERTLEVAIVGGGATGVELSAELYNAAKQLQSYGVRNVSEQALRVTLIEAGPTILPALPERISGAARQELQKLGVQVRESTMITRAEKGVLHTKSGEAISAKLMVWAAGIKGADFLKDIAGLETNRINQIEVKRTLQTTVDDDIFVIGDCASCMQDDGKRVPPRAQSAHQMATCALKNIIAKIKGQPLKDYTYRDYGSLVSLSNFSTVGSLMGNLTRGSMMVEGRIARMVYISLYRIHQKALHGWFHMLLIMLQARMNKYLRPRLKLH